MDVRRDDDRAAQATRRVVERVEQQGVVGAVEARCGQQAVRHAVRVEHRQIILDGAVALGFGMPVGRERQAAPHDMRV